MKPDRVSGRSKRFAIPLVMLALGWPAAATEIPLNQRKSGYDFMTRETRAMQDDDTVNPGMLWVLDGEALMGAKSRRRPTNPAPTAMAMRAPA